MPWATDNKIFEHFSDLKERGVFLRLVAKIRKDSHLPPAGLDMKKMIEESVKANGSPVFFWEAHVSPKDRETIEKGAQQILEKLKLGPHLEEIVTAYIVKGDEYKKGMNTFTSVTVGCALYDHDDHFLLYIYPEATKNHVVTFLENNWDWIEHWFKDRYPERQSLKVKKRTTRERDEQIIELYDWGVLTASGNPKRERAVEFFARRGLKTEDPVFELNDNFKKLGINLPKPDAIKKVIQRHNKRRKG